MMLSSSSTFPPRRPARLLPNSRMRRRAWKGPKKAPPPPPPPLPLRRRRLARLRQAPGASAPATRSWSSAPTRPERTCSPRSGAARFSTASRRPSSSRMRSSSSHSRRILKGWGSSFSAHRWPSISPSSSRCVTDRHGSSRILRAWPARPVPPVRPSPVVGCCAAATLHHLCTTSAPPLHLARFDGGGLISAELAIALHDMAWRGHDVA